MPLINLFEADWRDCLKAHYQHVLEEHDSENERSLITVLHDSGFGDDEIQTMRGNILGESDAISEETVIAPAVAALLTAPIDMVELTEISETEITETLAMVEASATPAVLPEASPEESPTINTTMAAPQPAKLMPGKSKKPKQMPLF